MHPLDFLSHWLVVRTNQFQIAVCSLDPTSIWKDAYHDFQNKLSIYFSVYSKLS